MAAGHPREFLRFIEDMPLEAEPEVFTRDDEFVVTLPEVRLLPTLWSAPRNVRVTLPVAPPIASHPQRVLSPMRTGAHHRL